MEMEKQNRKQHVQVQEQDGYRPMEDTEVMIKFNKYLEQRKILEFSRENVMNISCS